jgi:molecular chaperone DnaJ
MAERDYYDVLGVPRDATTEQIRKSYRKLALKYHPDRNPDDPEAEAKFKEAAEAYDVLSNEQTRQRYDRYGMAGVGGHSEHSFNSYEDIFSAFSDVFGGGGVFDEFFGRSRGRRPRRGRSLRVTLELELAEVLTGVEKDITLTRPEVCSACGGTGAEDEGVRTCGTCRGHGQVERGQGFFRLRSTCPKCGGDGRIIVDRCSECRGQGRISREVVVNVHVPAGVENGTRLRLQGEGEPAVDGPPGDLYCDVIIRPHDVFERDGDDLCCEVPISYTVAVLGGEVAVPVLDGGTHELTVPRGTQSGQVLPVTGMGLPNLQTQRRGDLRVRVLVETPRKLTERQEELLRELAEIEHVNVSERRRGWLDKIKDYLVGRDQDETEKQ